MVSIRSPCGASVRTVSQAGGMTTLSPTHTPLSAALPYRFNVRLPERHRRFLLAHAAMAGVSTSEAVRDFLDELISEALAHDPDGTWAEILEAREVDGDDLQLG